MTKLRWHPKTGEAKELADDETVPKGWLDHHPADPDKATVKPQEPEGEKAMSATELAAALRAGGITFPDDAKADELEHLLVNGVRAHLDSRKIAYDPTDGPRKLLALASAK